MSVSSNTDRTDYTDLALSLFLFDNFHLVILRIQIEPVILTLDLKCFYILLYLFNLFICVRFTLNTNYFTLRSISRPS